MQGITNKHTNIFGAILHDSSPVSSQILTIKEFVKHFYWLPITSELVFSRFGVEVFRKHFGKKNFIYLMTL